MNKLYLLKNPELFQGENKLKKCKQYFEGWYFKHIKDNNAISFIPGINVQNKTPYAFIQVITNKNSYYISYNFDEFEYGFNPFFIKIGNNYFSKEGIHIDIKDENQSIYICGDLKYKDLLSINKNFLCPNIMGPFSYVPFMECNHAIISMNHNVYGNLSINNKNFSFENANGYVEKDWGVSFPKEYIWCQTNSFKNSNASIFCSIADIPFKIFNFKGFICVFNLNNKEYKFTTYNNSKLEMFEINSNLLEIQLKKGIYKLIISCEQSNGLNLSAPVKGQMNKIIKETLSSNIYVILKENNNIIFSDFSNNGGLETVQNV